MPAITTLDQLLDVLTTEPNSYETARAYGLPESAHDDGVDWTSLPAYGGPEPRHTECVWSWDETRLLVGTCADDLQIVPRDDDEDEDDDEEAV